MNGNDFMGIIGGLDDSLIQEASVRPAVRQRRVLTRWIAAAVCFVILFGCTAYATGMFNNVFNHREYNSNEHEYIGKIEVQGYAIETELPIVDPAEIKGDVRSIKTEEGTGSVYGLKKEDLPGYIGYGPFDGIWFPYDKYEAFVSIEEESPEDGIKTIKVGVCNFTVSKATFDVISPDNADADFLVKSTATIRVKTKTDKADLEPFGVRYTERDEHTVITSKGGCECHIITADYEGRFSIMGVTAKNGIWYEMTVYFRNESDRTEAERIVRAWAEQF